MSRQLVGSACLGIVALGITFGMGTLGGASKAWAHFPVGPEIQVNEYTTGDQKPGLEGRKVVGLDSSGNIFVVWNSQNQVSGSSGWDVYARIFDNTGEPLTSEILVNQVTANDQYNACVTVRPNGEFLVCWESTNQDGDMTGVYARRFNINGTPLENEFLVNTYTTGEQFHPKAVYDTLGNFIIIWTGKEYTTNNKDVFAKKYDTNRNVLIGETVMNSDKTTSYQTQPCLAIDGNNNIYIAWQNTEPPDYATVDWYVRKFNSSFAPLTSSIRANTYTTNHQQFGDIAVNSSGQAVVVWHSIDQDGDNFGVYGQRFNTSFSKVGSEFQVNQYTTSLQGFPTVWIDNSGNYFIAYESIISPELREIYGRLYNSSGVAQTPEYRLNLTNEENQQFPALALDNNGNGVAAWTSRGQDGDGYGMYFRQIEGSSNDDYLEESNNLCENAQLIIPNTYTGLLAADDDWYEILVPENKRISVDIDFLHSNGDLDLYLYEDDCQSLVGSSATLNDTESITGFNFGGTERTYKILVSGLNSSYTMTVSFNDLEDSYEDNETINDVLNASPLPMNVLEPNLALLDEDWYRIALSDCDNLRITVLFNHSQGDINIELYDARCYPASEPFRIAESYSQTNNEIVTYVNNTGNYELFLRVYGEQGAATLSSYGVLIETLGNDDPYEPNSTPYQDIPLVLGQQYNDLVVKDDDFFTYDVTGVDYIKVNVDHYFHLGQLYFQVLEDNDSYTVINGGSSAFYTPNQSEMEMGGIWVGDRESVVIRVFGATRGTNFYDLLVTEDTP